VKLSERFRVASYLGALHTALEAERLTSNEPPAVRLEDLGLHGASRGGNVEWSHNTGTYRTGASRSIRASTDTASFSWIGRPQHEHVRYR